jgi:hypothetical protein
MPDIRETREIEHLCGIGGYIEFRRSQPGTPYTPSAMEILEIQEWRIEHEYINVRLPMSGGEGSISRRRVADDFQFVAELDLDLTPARKVLTPEEIAAGVTGDPHLDDRLNGHPDDEFRLAMTFHCGDPTFWTHPKVRSIARPAETEKGVTYFCEEVLLNKVCPVNSARGDDVVRYRIQGEGSAPLQRLINDRVLGMGAL